MALRYAVRVPTEASPTAIHKRLAARRSPPAGGLASALCWLLVLPGLAAPDTPLRVASHPPAVSAPTRDAAVERVIIDAVRLAYGLEQAYWDAPERWPTWEQLNAHYRAGFSNELAQAMTDYSRAGSSDPATWVPDEVRVADINGNSALVWFTTPPEFGRDSPWGLEAYMVLRLRREDSGRWVVYWGTDNATPP